MQGMLVLVTQLQGPLHTHETALGDEKAIPSVVDLWDQNEVGSAQHQHAELGKARHFHSHDESGVVFDDADQHETAVIESGMQKFGSSGLFITLVSICISIQTPELSFAANGTPLLALASRYLPRLERPPATRQS